jgi:ppGpp synthetase/RelA/SpoT-type nucleotidyltranferase
MANQQYHDQKRPLNYTKGEINRAGDSIRHGINGDKRVDAIKKIQSFREYHLYPLMLLKNHLSRTANRVGKKVIVARRLKRLPTIINKLERPTLDGGMANSIRITAMQDIAGCRAIVKNTKQLFDLKARLESSTSVHQITNTRDYLTCPKDSGYGGIHLIYSCYKGQEEHPWKGAKVEVQLRTELQHAWATSLEIIDTLEGMNLKTSHDGHEDWRRFFSISGRLVAHSEKLCTLDDEPLGELRRDLADLEQKLNVRKQLARYTIGISFTNHKQIPKSKLSGNGMFLVVIPRPDVNEKSKEIGLKVTISSFSSKKSDEALKRLNESELDDSIMLSVLLSAPDVRMLKQAYPNYFGSTQQFADFISSHLLEGK